MEIPKNNLLKSILGQTIIGANGYAPKCLGAPALNLEIKGVPKILKLYDATNELIFFNRLGKILEAYKISKNSLIIHNPFNEERLNISIESKTSSFGGYAWINTPINISNLSVGLGLLASNRFAELECGVYFLQYTESYINQSNVEKLIVFDRSIKKWTNSEIVSFVKRFSKKLRNIKIVCRFQDKEAFDSIFLPDEVIVDIREDIDNFLISRDMYRNDLNLAWRRGYMLVGPPGCGKTLLVRVAYGTIHFLKICIGIIIPLMVMLIIQKRITFLIISSRERPRTLMKIE